MQISKAAHCARLRQMAKSHQGPHVDKNWPREGVYGHSRLFLANCILLTTFLDIFGHMSSHQCTFFDGRSFWLRSCPNVVDYLCAPSSFKISLFSQFLSHVFYSWDHIPCYTSRHESSSHPAQTTNQPFSSDRSRVTHLNFFDNHVRKLEGLPRVGEGTSEWK